MDHEIVKGEVINAAIESLSGTTRETLVAQVAQAITEAGAATNKQAQLGRGFDEAIKQIVFETSLEMLRRDPTIKQEVQGLVAKVMGPGAEATPGTPRGPTQTWYTARFPDGGFLPHLSGVTSNEALGRLQVHLGGVAAWNEVSASHPIVTIKVTELA